MMADNRGQVTANQAVSTIVALVVLAIVAAFLLPIGISELAGADLGENASTAATAMWAILDALIVLAVFLLVINIATRFA